MKLTFTKAAAALTIAAAATFAPVAAQAVTYPPANAAAVSSPTVAPGGVVTFSVIPGVFVPGEPVTITLTGENASGGSLAFAKAVYETARLGTVPAAADGSLSQGVRLPANATGTYIITATSPSVPAGVSATVTIAAAGGGTGPGAGLPATGLDSGSLLGLGSAAARSSSPVVRSPWVRRFTVSASRPRNTLSEEGRPVRGAALFACPRSGDAEARRTTPAWDRRAGSGHHGG